MFSRSKQKKTHVTISNCLKVLLIETDAASQFRTVAVDTKLFWPAITHN